MHFSPVLRATGTYPFVRLERARRSLAAAGVELVDFGKGDPMEPTDARIRQALVDGLEERMGYPLAGGLPELRAAIAGWCARRFGVELDPDREIVPTYGSKEAIFLLAQVVVDRDSEKRLVLTTEPGYPVPDRGAAFAGAELEQLPLLERSSMTGYRSGFVAADAELIAALKQFRPTVGTAPQEFVQRASIVAWNDESHVEQTRERYRRKREGLLDVLERKRIRSAGGPATMYLWLEVPGGATSEAFAERLLEHGVIVSPGSFFGPAGEGYWRIALVPTEDECRRAAQILEGVL